MYQDLTELIETAKQDTNPSEIVDGETLLSELDSTCYPFDSSKINLNNEAIVCASFEKEFTLTGMPTELFWLNDYNAKEGTAFGIYKITLKDADGNEKPLWEGLAGVRSMDQCYYGSITPKGFSTCWDDATSKPRDNAEYQSFSVSQPGIWVDYLNPNFYEEFDVNAYATGGVSAVFTGSPNIYSNNISYLEAGSTKDYYVNVVNHSSQKANVSFNESAREYFDNYSDFELEAGGALALKINNSKLTASDEILDFSITYTYDDVIDADGNVAVFTQPAYIGVVELAMSSTDEFVLKDSGNIMNLTHKFEANTGNFETVSISNSGSDDVDFEFNYYVDLNGVTDWRTLDLKLHVSKSGTHRNHLNSEDDKLGSISISGNNDATIRMMNLVTSSDGTSTEGPAGEAVIGTPYSPKFEAADSLEVGTIYADGDNAWFKFFGKTFGPSETSEASGKITFTDMLWKDGSPNIFATKADDTKFSGDINVYAFDKSALNAYLGEDGLGANWAPMSARYNSEKFNAYQTALNAAMAVLADQKTNQAEIDTALAELTQAVEALKSTDNLANQVAQVTYTYYADGALDNGVAQSTSPKYVLYNIGEEVTLGGYAPYAELLEANVSGTERTPKQSSITKTFDFDDIDVNDMLYSYWSVDVTGVNSAIESAQTALADTALGAEYVTAITEAKAALEAIDQTAGTDTPETQAEIDNAIAYLDSLLAHKTARAELSELIENGNLLDSEKTAAQAVLDANILPEGATADDKDTIDASTKAMTDEIARLEAGITDGTLTKADYKPYDDAKAAYDALVANEDFGDMSDTDAEAVANAIAAVEAWKADPTLTSAKNEDIKAQAKIISDLVDSYSVCVITGHDWGEATYEDAETPTVNNVRTYTEVCSKCGKKVETIAPRAVYTELNTAVEALRAIDTSKLTETAAKAVTDAIAEYESFDKNLPATVTSDTGETFTGGEEAIRALAERLAQLATDTNAGIANGTLARPDFSEIIPEIETYNTITAALIPEGTDKDAAEQILSDIAAWQADPNATAAQYQATIDGYAKTLSDINDKYAGCSQGNHDWEIVDYTAVTDPTADKVGTYNYKCSTNCGETKSIDVPRESYSSLDDEKAILTGLLSANLTPEARAEIQTVLAQADGTATGEAASGNLEQNLPAAIKGLNGEDLDQLSKTTIEGFEEKLQAVIDKYADEDGNPKANALSPDFDAYDVAKDTYDSLAATKDVLESIKTEVATLSTAIEAIRGDENATKADNQATIDNATARLNEIIEGINNGTLVKPNYKPAEDAIKAAEENLNIPAEVAEEVAEYKAAIEELKAKTEPEANADADQKTVDDIKAAVETIVEKYKNCKDGHDYGDPVLTKNPTAEEQGEYTETCSRCGATRVTKVNLASYTELETAVEALEAVDTENLTAETKAQITALLAEETALDKNLPADVEIDGEIVKGGQDTIDDLKGRINTLLSKLNAGDPTLVKPDYTVAEEKLTEAEKLSGIVTDPTTVENVKPSAIEEIKALRTELEGIQSKTNPEATKAADQEQVNRIAKDLEEIIKGIENGTLVDPDYKPAEDAIKAAEENLNIPAEVAEEVAGYKAALETIKNDPTTDISKQPDVDAIKAAVETIVNKYAACKDGHDYGEAVLTKNPTAEEQGEYTETCSRCGATRVTKVNLAGYTELETAVDTLKAVDTENLTAETKAQITALLAEETALDKNLPADVEIDGEIVKGGQDTIDDLKGRINTLLSKLNAGDPTLVKPDYTVAEEKLTEAEKLSGIVTDPTTVENVKPSAIEEIKALRTELEGIQGKTNPEATKAADQEQVNRIAKDLEAIINGINNGTLVDPDYKPAEDAIKAAEENLNIPAEVAEEVAGYKAALETIKNDPTTDISKQPDVDAIKAAVETIVNKYAACKDGHTEVTDGAVGATCTTTGLTEGSHCSACGTVIVAQQTVPVKHTAAEATKEKITEATCSKSGSYDEVVYCSLCSTEISRKQVVTDPNPEKHALLEHKGYAATCTKPGLTAWYECLWCDYETKAVAIPAPGHTEGEWLNTKTPTCDATGTETLYCSVCSEAINTRTVAALGHKWGDWTLETEATCKSYEVQICECSVCGKKQTREYTQGGYADHKYEAVGAKAPTCDEAGYSAHEKCKWCDSKIGYSEIEAAGHIWSDWMSLTPATCQTYEILMRTCPACTATQTRENKEGGYAGHSYIDVSAKEPTCDAEGYAAYEKCEWCSESKGYQTIPAKGHNDADGDGFCDACGHDDGCACHKGNLWSKIMRLVYSCFSFMFRTKITCCDDMVWYFDGIDDIT